jgi:hypothetical protein
MWNRREISVSSLIMTDPIIFTRARSLAGDLYY